MLLPAKCPECGGLIEVDNEKRAGLCLHCGQPFVVEDAIKTFNVCYNVSGNFTANHNYGEGTVVNIYEDKSKDFVIEGGVLKKYQGASVDVVIPDGVLKIGNACFKGLQIKSVVIPDSVTHIGAYAFSDCIKLSKVKLPKNPEHIDLTSFQGCKEYIPEIIDENILKAIDYIVETENATSTRLGKYMGFDFEKTFAILDIAERIGVIEPFNKNIPKPRKVLVSAEQWEQIRKKYMKP